MIVLLPKLSLLCCWQLPLMHFAMEAVLRSCMDATVVGIRFAYSQARLADVGRCYQYLQKLFVFVRAVAVGSLKGELRWNSL